MAQPKKEVAKREQPRREEVEEEEEKPEKVREARQPSEIFSKLKKGLRQLGYEKVYAEALGTFILVFVGAGSVLATSISGGVNYLTVGLAHGLALTVIIYSLSKVSGALVNPALTIALYLTGKMKLEKAAYYVVSQLVGATLAGLVLLSIFGGIASPTLNLGVNDLRAVLSPARGTVTEAVLTFFLVFVILAASDDKESSRAESSLMVGLVLAVGIFVGGPITGGSLNPARAFGPALVSGHWSNHLVYWVGPIVGAVIAAYAYMMLFRKVKEP